MKIHTIGGYSEVGKNMTVLEMNDDAIIFDQGLYLPAVIELEERERNNYNPKLLRRVGALPDDYILDKRNIRNKVRSIIIGHAHLDHVGGVPFMADRYNANIYGTPFTLQVLKTMLRDQEIRLRNKIKSISPNGKFTVDGKKRSYEVELINMTHSTPQTALVAVHTPQGVMVYANDFKIDDNPIFGQKPNYKALRRLAKEGVKAVIVDSLYSRKEGKTPSEKVARHLLEEVMLTPDNYNHGMIVTTFSSHIARLKSIVEFGKKLNRKILFVGRSLNKYVNSAKNAEICPFINDIKLVSYRRQVEAALRKANRNKKEYLLVCTGHQGEPGSVLEKLSRGFYPYKVSSNDHIIFSSSTIPSEINIANKGSLVKKLSKSGARIFQDIHASGHGQKEDLRDFINILQPENIIPSHGNTELVAPMIELAKEMGYKFKKNSHLMGDSDSIVFK